MKKTIICIFALIMIILCSASKPHQTYTDQDFETVVEQIGSFTDQGLSIGPEFEDLLRKVQSGQ